LILCIEHAKRSTHSVVDERDVLVDAETSPWLALDHREQDCASTPFSEPRLRTAISAQQAAHRE
jgi:hypothetical protein